jgi:hypothetical protein
MDIHGIRPPRCPSRRSPRSICQAITLQFIIAWSVQRGDHGTACNFGAAIDMVVPSQNTFAEYQKPFRDVINTFAEDSRNKHLKDLVTDSVLTADSLAWDES